MQNTTDVSPVVSSEFFGNNNLTMSSKEIADLVESRHDKVKQSIERLSKRGVISLPPLGENPTSEIGGRPGTVYQLDKRSSLIVVAQLSPEFTARVVDRWEALETGKATPIFQSATDPLKGAEIDMVFYREACEQLRLNDGSKIQMLSTICKNHGRPTNFLPAYTEEKLTKSLTVLLKEHNAPFGAKKANVALINKGLVEIKSRPSTKGNRIKEFKSLTGKGLKYGKNLVCPNNQRETQPHFYEDTFSDLLRVIAN